MSRGEIEIVHIVESLLDLGYGGAGSTGSGREASDDEDREQCSDCSCDGHSFIGRATGLGAPARLSRCGLFCCRRRHSSPGEDEPGSRPWRTRWRTSDIVAFTVANMVRPESHGAPLTSGEKANGEVAYSTRADSRQKCGRGCPREAPAYRCAHSAPGDSRSAHCYCSTRSLEASQTRPIFLGRGFPSSVMNGIELYLQAVEFVERLPR